MVLHSETKNWRKNHCAPTFFSPNTLHFDIPLQHKNKSFFCNAIKGIFKGVVSLYYLFFKGQKAIVPQRLFSQKRYISGVPAPPSLNPVSQASHSKKVICRICNPKICSVCICAIDKQIFECYT